MSDLYPEVHCFLKADDGHRAALEAVWSRLEGADHWCWSGKVSDADVLFVDASCSMGQQSAYQDAGVEVLRLPTLGAPAYAERVLESLQKVLWYSNSAVALSWRSAAQVIGPALEDIAIQSRLGGGQAWLYRALDKRVGQSCVVKCSSADAERLQCETQALLDLGGFSAPRLMKVCGWAGRPLLVMEWLPPMLLNPQRDGESKVLAALRELMRLVDAVHAQGWVHGDIKPDHCRLSSSGHMRLIDWGCARHRSSEPTTAQWQGTPWYMAPELFNEGSSVTRASDYYAVGALAFEWLMGAPPEAVYSHGYVLAGHEWRNNMSKQVATRYGSTVATWLSGLLASRPQDRDWMTI